MSDEPDEKPRVEYDLGCGAIIAIIVICATLVLIFGGS